MTDLLERTALYRLYDTADRLLYVGITNDPKERMKAHAGDKDWWPSVCTRDFEWFASREEAAAAEVIAIREEQPAHNRTHNTWGVLVLLPAAAEDTLRPQPKLVTVDERGAGQRIAADIRALAMAGDITVGKRLPSTQHLRDRYKVSNVTVQRGLRILKDEGFVVGRAGSAVFVTSPVPEHAADAGYYEERQISSGEVVPPRQIREIFGLPDGQAVPHDRRIISCDNRPLRLVTAFIPAASESSEAVEFEDHITTRPPTSEEAVALQVPEEVPVMVVVRQLLDSAGSPLQAEVHIEPGHLCQRRYRIPVE